MQTHSLPKDWPEAARGRGLYLRARAAPSPSFPGRSVAPPHGPCGTGTPGEGGPHGAAGEQRVRSFRHAHRDPWGPPAPSPEATSPALHKFRKHPHHSEHHFHVGLGESVGTSCAT